MRSLGLSALSFVLTGIVIGNAYYHKKQFYPSVVYITKSNPSMAVIYIQFFVIVLMLGKLLRKIFLGTLRAAEFEHYMERFWYALTETCLAFTVFRDDFNPRFVALFTVLLFLKSFHWLAEERVDYMERSPMIGWLFHIRVTSLLSILGFLDYLMILHAYTSTITKGPTVQLVFGFEYAILIIMVANTTIKYVLHAAEMRADAPWENKAVFLLYTELIIGLIKVILYVLFVVIMAKIYALPMFVFRPMFYTMRNFKKALNDVIMSRRAIRNMNTLYPDATPEELEQSDNICIICREDMINNSKKLPCGHIFHTSCLRSWFQRQQTCPTCRLNILRTHHTNSSQLPRQDGNANVAPQAQAAGIGNAANQNQVPGFNNNLQNQNPFAHIFAQNLGNINNFAAGAAPTSSANNISANNTATTTTTTGATGSTVPPFVLPPFPFIAPFAMPPPPMPPGLDTLTDEELRAIEGNERKHVEERIKLLRNIQLLLDASVALMNQYSAVTAHLAPIPIPPTTAAPSSTSQASSSSNASGPTQENCETVTANSSGFNFPQINEKDLPGTSKSSSDVKIEDIGSEEKIDLSKDLSKDVNLLNSVNNETKGKTNGTSISNENENSELNEIRRRRLQKFLNEERNDNN
ncbi:E3 ubiquitin-protein ligase HRD1 [Condylostylus longicornis]|uniref:E3 ubiquitin-protein ligase HRD1 n=1 Tax=Condylostylus longicornis TaxID=2530218 RepID=UPI00244E0D38|nr:E3 ubiquitin-protein ligase HRD1 [Condylostylus longicornis]